MKAILWKRMDVAVVVAVSIMALIICVTDGEAYGSGGTNGSWFRLEMP
jgi:hypothetical protein